MPSKKKGAAAKKPQPDLPSYYDYSEFVAPAWFPPAPTPETLAPLATSCRTVIEAQHANPRILLRIRQKDWSDFHDVFVSAEKKWSMLRLQDVIAKSIMGGGVRKEDVIILLPRGAGEAAGLESGDALRVVVKDGPAEPGDAGAENPEADRNTSGEVVSIAVDADPISTSHTVGSARSHEGPISFQAADLLLTIDACFSIPLTSTTSEFLPPGRVLPSHELHEMMTVQARAAHLAAFLASQKPSSTSFSAERPRRMTLAAGNNGGLAAPLGNARRPSFAVRQPSSMGSAEAGPMPPIVLPTAIDVWYDVLLPTRKQPERRASLEEEFHCGPHVSDNPVIMFEGYVAAKRPRTREFSGRQGGMIGALVAAPVAVNKKLPPPCVPKVVAMTTFTEEEGEP